MQPETSFPYLRYNPLQIFCRSKTPVALYARQKWLHQDDTKSWENDFHETVNALFAGQYANGSWNNSPVTTIRALFGLHLTVRQKDPEIERGLEWLLSKQVLSERYPRRVNGPHRVSIRELHGLPFSGGSFDCFAKGAVLFLATLFGMENEPRVVSIYETLRLLGEKR
jgi:hypothetical protein